MRWGCTPTRPPKMSIFYTLYIGAKIRYFRRSSWSVISKEMIISGPEITPIFEGDPTISKIGNVPLQNIQRVGPQPKLSLNHHHYLYWQTEF